MSLRLLALILECDMTQSNAITRIRLNLMRQNNFRIFKELLSKDSCESFKGTNRRCTARDACVDLTSEVRVGGASRDRTDDLLLAKQALSQLSYGP